MGSNKRVISIADFQGKNWQQICFSIANLLFYLRIIFNLYIVLLIHITQFEYLSFIYLYIVLSMCLFNDISRWNTGSLTLTDVKHHQTVSWWMATCCKIWCGAGVLDNDSELEVGTLPTHKLPLSLIFNDFKSS